MKKICILEKHWWYALLPSPARNGQWVYDLVFFIYQPLLIASIIHRGKNSLKSYTDYVQNIQSKKMLKIFDILKYLMYNIDTIRLKLCNLIEQWWNYMS